MGTQPRRHPRVLVDMSVEVRAERMLRANARDLSEAGVRLRIQGRVRTGDRVGMTIHVPGRPDVVVPAEVRWVCPHDSGVGCDAGLEFDHSPLTQRRIGAVLWDLQTGELASIARRSRTRLPGQTG